jgi:hypothetical protein
MTFEEMKTDVWGNLGNPSNLDPSSSSTIGEWVNRGYKKILFWKLPNGRLLRFRCTEGEVFFKTTVKTGTAEDGSSSTITLKSGAVGANDDQYNGWLVRLTGGTGSGQVRLVTDYNGTNRVATVHKAWDITPDSTSTYTLYKRFTKILESGDVGASENLILSPISSLYTISKITDLEDGKDLLPAERTETWADELTEDAIPEEYLLRGNSLFFNTAYSSERWYRMEYVKIPADLSSDEDEPEIPEPWHEAIVLWATWRGLRYMQESNEAYSVKRDLFDFLEMTVTEGEMSFEREHSGVQLDLGR